MASSSSSSSSSPGFTKGLPPSKLVQSALGSPRHVAIVRTRWNSQVVEALRAGVVKIFISHGPGVTFEEFEVSGAFELPFACQYALKRGHRPCDAAIALGCLIKGQTAHFDYICDAVSNGLMRVGLDVGKPVIFGVLTVFNEEQALARCGLGSGEVHNHGEDYAFAALEMCDYRHTTEARLSTTTS